MMNAKTAKSLAGDQPSHPLITIAPDELASDALDRMRESNVSHLVVVQDGKCVGLVTARELMEAIPRRRQSVAPASAVKVQGRAMISATKPEYWYGSGHRVSVSEIMRDQVPTVDESADIGTALALMLENGLTALPMTRDGIVTNIVTETDLLRLLQKLGSRAEAKSASLLSQGESAMATPLMQNLMHSLASAGI